MILAVLWGNGKEAEDVQLAPPPLENASRGADDVKTKPFDCYGSLEIAPLPILTLGSERLNYYQEHQIVCIILFLML